MTASWPRLVGAIGLALTLFVIAGCGSPRSAITTGPDGLRTFTWRHDRPCPAFGIIPPVAGVLRGERGEREPVWIEAPDGRRLSVVWPAGFSVTFGPGAELRNERGIVVARDGDAIKLGQTALDEATGTYDDPYVAHGLPIEGGCYPYEA